jgi:hypothetical protein
VQDVSSRITTPPPPLHRAPAVLLRGGLLRGGAAKGPLRDREKGKAMNTKLNICELAGKHQSCKQCSHGTRHSEHDGCSEPTTCFAEHAKVKCVPVKEKKP